MSNKTVRLIRKQKREVSGFRWDLTSKTNKLLQ